MSIIQWRQATRHTWRGQTLGADRWLVAKQIDAFNAQVFRVFAIQPNGGITWIASPMTSDFVTLQEAQDAAEDMLPDLVRLAAIDYAQPGG